MYNTSNLDQDVQVLISGEGIKGKGEEYDEGYKSKAYMHLASETLVKKNVIIRRYNRKGWHWIREDLTWPWAMMKESQFFLTTRSMYRH